MEKEFSVSRESQGLRLDKFLSEELGSLSREKIINLIRRQRVWVDGEVKKPSFALRMHQKVRIRIEEEKNELKPFEFEVKIVYEDEYIIVVDKPHDLVVHPPQAGYQRTLVNALLAQEKNLYPSQSLRPGVVHRLDRDTSGLMVLAKTSEAFEGLGRQFKQRKVFKEYRAICHGIIHKDTLAVNLPLGRNGRNRLKMKIRLARSKEALTRIRVLERLIDSTYLAVTIVTGRMHQIRVHLKFLGHPLLGDKKYGIKDGQAELLLHSYFLGFTHPVTGEPMEFTSVLPERFKDYLKERRCIP
jgi:23S rRNA pseudouridine1911/1915/1917 synthase